MEIYFIGSYNCKADAKGRVMLPVTLKNQLTPILTEGFFIKRSYMNDNCLELYPMNEWNTVMKELNDKNRYDDDVLDFIRMFTAGLKQIEIDTTGRLLIPKNLVTQVGITKEIVLLSMGKYLEIWDKDIYEERINVSLDKRKALARKVMGRAIDGDGVS